MRHHKIGRQLSRIVLKLIQFIIVVQLSHVYVMMSVLQFYLTTLVHVIKNVQVVILELSSVVIDQEIMLQWLILNS